MLVNKDEINGVAGEGFTAATVLRVVLKYFCDGGRRKKHDRLVIKILICILKPSAQL